MNDKLVKMIRKLCKMQGRDRAFYKEIKATIKQLNAEGRQQAKRTMYRVIMAGNKS